MPEEHLLGPRGHGFKQFLHILDIGRIGVAAMGVGLAQGALDEALAYAKERQAFGQSISKFQAIQAKLADMATEIEAARLLTYKAALAEGPGPQLHADRRAGEAQDRPARGALRRGGRADPRRLRLHRGVPGVPLLPRREDPHDRRGHRRGAADGHRARAGGMSGRAVRIREVGPRDGFQNEPEVIPTDAKVELVDALARTGLPRLEVTSFVRADVIPQLADAARGARRAVDVPDGRRA